MTTERQLTLAAMVAERVLVWSSLEALVAEAYMVLAQGAEKCVLASEREASNTVQRSGLSSSSPSSSGCGCRAPLMLGNQLTRVLSKHWTAALKKILAG